MSRLLSDPERDQLYSLASVLIPASPTMPAADQVEDMGLLLGRATAACGYPSEAIAQALAKLPGVIDWDSVRRYAAQFPQDFAILSTIASGAYYMAADVLGKLGFPGSRQQPAEMEEFVNELESGIFEPVMVRAPLFRTVPGAA